MAGLGVGNILRGEVASYEGKLREQSTTVSWQRGGLGPVSLQVWSMASPGGFLEV